MLLYLLMQNYSISDMNIYDENNSFYKVYKSVLIDKADMLENWLDNAMLNYFSNSTTRLIYSKLYNPKHFEHCTLLLDGRHNKIIIEDIDLDKKELYSYKLKKNALNTQFVIDSAGYIVYVSESLPCKFNNDDNMLIRNINFTKFFKLTDCICHDGIYQNVLDEIITKYKNIGLQISEDNFCFPIQKEKNKKLNDDELNFNQQFGSYRNTIETYFANFSKIFKRFSYSANVRITKNRTYNIQLKLALVLYNIKLFVEKNSIEEKEYYKLWLQENFDFFNNFGDFSVSDHSDKVMYKKENIINIKSIQDDLLNKILCDNNSCNVLKKNKMEIDNNNIKEDSKDYEVQYIIQHKKIDGKYKYEVKWRNYRKQLNSWVDEEDFNSKNIIDDYWKTIK